MTFNCTTHKNQLTRLSSLPSKYILSFNNVILDTAALFSRIRIFSKIKQAEIFGNNSQWGEGCGGSMVNESQSQIILTDLF